LKKRRIHNLKKKVQKPINTSKKKTKQNRKKKQKKIKDV